MTQTMLEHVNFTVPDAKASAQLMCDLFGWKVRWQGPAKGDGFTVHVGSDDAYLALYSPPTPPASGDRNVDVTGHMNHVGVVVDDLDAVEQAIVAAGFTTRNHASYTPGRRFYFDDPDGIEIEVVTYS